MKTNLTCTVALLAGLMAAGCSNAPTAPAPGASGAGGSSRGPALIDVQVRYTGQALLVTAALAPWQSSRFSPDLGGGWCFQLFLDTDERPTGYGRGLDYLVRAIEVTPDGSVHVRRTEGGSGPGGWGESVGMVNLSHEQGRVAFIVPLRMLQDDGRVAFVLELYETLEKKDGGVWHEFVVGYEGTSVSTGGDSGPFTLRREALTSGSSRLP